MPQLSYSHNSEFFNNETFYFHCGEEHVRICYRQLERFDEVVPGNGGADYFEDALLIFGEVVAQFVHTRGALALRDAERYKNIFS